MVSNTFYFHPYLGKIPNLTNIFQRGWFNHQSDNHKLLFSVGGGKIPDDSPGAFLEDRTHCAHWPCCSSAFGAAKLGKWLTKGGFAFSLGTHKCELLISCVVSEAL